MTSANGKDVGIISAKALNTHYKEQRDFACEDGAGKAFATTQAQAALVAHADRPGRWRAPSRTLDLQPSIVARTCRWRHAAPDRWPPTDTNIIEAIRHTVGFAPTEIKDHGLTRVTSSSNPLNRDGWVRVMHDGIVRFGCWRQGRDLAGRAAVGIEVRILKSDTVGADSLDVYVAGGVVI
jgi:hypothetical protein